MVLSGVFYKPRDNFISLCSVIRVLGEVCLNGSRELLISRDCFSDKVVDLVFISLEFSLIYLDY